MCLLRQFIIGIAISIDGSIQLLECHKGSDKLVVGMEESAKPLFRLHMLDLGIRLAHRHTNLSQETYVSQDFSAEEFTELKVMGGSLILRDSLLLAIDQSKGIQEIGRCHG
jgi:hypothetical protein